MKLGDIYFIDSDKDTHFTGALIQNAIENESIAFPSILTDTGVHGLLIVGISVQADEQLDWDIILWGKSTFSSTDLDSDNFIDFFNFPTASGKRIAGANQYYWASPANNVEVFYKDLDNSGKLHVGLVNRNAGAKTAGAAGEIKIRFSVRPILG